MRRLSIALALLLVAPLATAQVYKWTDAQGTTHYSESPPPVGTKYSQVTVSGADQPVSAPSGSDAAAPAPSSSGTAQNSDGAPAGMMVDNPANRAKLCATLKNSINTLQGAAPVVMQGSGGQQQLLNPDQRKQQLDASQSQFQQYCSNSSS
ncbi:DUF4124 domain-containing protein [Dyella acidiphila]|uniref:DUF4124 domain-containing protein n=1 Tax=Dyella acidiphila TaxID=2775866 RepID=A0ABR9G459_9GAMM|nr:DUF4124 domain-containing protein [Dyella acidiphila]MBE1158835.1 DUF4124 domain-containing protein [Dyella acidiphila]